MTSPNDPDDMQHPQDAAHWFARMQSGEATEDDRRAFEAWRAADPSHDRAYRNLAYFWDATLSVPQTRLRALMADAPAPPARAPLRRRFGLGIAGACALVAVVGIVAAQAQFGAQPQETLVLETRKGERSQWILPDGSVMDVNTDTVAVVRFYEDQRRVELQRGEAFFDVRVDLARPFVVDAGMGQVTVTGTRFNVRRSAEALQVSVHSGSVRVRAGHWWNRSERSLAANQQAVAHAGQGLGEITPANVSDIVAWQRGKVIFNNTPLDAVIDEMNRYMPQPVRLDAAQLGRHHVSGVFSVDDPNAMIDALPAIAPVQVRRLLDGQVRIDAR